MVFPLIPVAAYGLAAAGSAVGIYGAIKDMNYQRGRYNEIQRYWNDYYHNTGVRPKYPYRAGANFNWGSYYRDIGSILGNSGRFLKSGGRVYNEIRYG